MLQFSLAHRPGKITEGSGDRLDELTAMISIILSSSGSGSSGNMDLDRDPLQPLVPAAFCWACFIDSALIAEFSFAVSSS